MADLAERARPGRRIGLGAAIVVVLLALAVTVAIGIIRSATASTESVPVVAPAGDSTTPSPVTAGALYVHVAGAVAAPGLYRLEGGSRVVDGIAAAGGFIEGADEAAVNLARPLSDGEQVVVPVVGAVPAAGAAGSGAAAPGVTGDGRVNLNTADESALDTLPRIGPAMAERIISWREDNGGFTSVEDLLAVPGIGDKMLESLRDLVTV